MNLPGKTIPNLDAATALDVTDAGLFVFRPEGTGVASKLPVSALPAVAGGPGDVRRYGAVFDGTLHPLSEFFSTLTKARNKLGSFVNSLTESIDRCATQAAVNAVAFLDAGIGGCNEVILPPGIGIWDYPVTIGSRPVQIVGAGPWQTVLKHTINAPFFVSFPSAIPLPPVVSAGCPTGEKGFQFDGTINDGHLSPTDTSAADLTSFAAVTREAWVKIIAWPTIDFDFAMIFGRGGSWTQNSNDWDVSSEVSVYVTSGTKRIQVFYKKGATSDANNFAIPGPVPANGEWHHIAETRAGAVCKIWWDGQLAGTHTLTSLSGQTPQPWEDEWIGSEPLVYPHGFAIQKCLNGVIASYRLSKSVRYTTTFTPPTTPFTVDTNTLCIFGNLDNVDGLMVPVKNGYEAIQDGIIIWHKGNYSGDVSGAGFRGLRFYQGSFGIYGFGIHNAKLEYLSSQFTRYPIWLCGHSFENDIGSIYFSSCRNGVTLDGISSGSIHDYEIGPATIAVVSTDGNVDLASGFTFSLSGGTLLARGGQVMVRRLFQTDEAASGAIPFSVQCAGCQTVDVRSSFVYAALNGTVPIKLVGCMTASITDSWFAVHDSTTEIVKVTDGGPNASQPSLHKFVAQSNAVLSTSTNQISAVPFTLSPARFRAGDHQLPVSVLNNATLTTTILLGAGKSSAIQAIDATNDRSAYYLVDNTTLTLVAGNSVFSTVQGTGSKINVYASGGKITMENKTGGTLLLAAHEK